MERESGVDLQDVPNKTFRAHSLLKSDSGAFAVYQYFKEVKEDFSRVRMNSSFHSIYFQLCFRDMVWWKVLLAMVLRVLVKYIMDSS